LSDHKAHLQGNDPAPWNIGYSALADLQSRQIGRFDRESEESRTLRQLFIAQGNVQKLVIRIT
jgi:hypothetical protein